MQDHDGGIGLGSLMMDGMDLYVTDKQRPNLETSNEHCHVVNIYTM